MDPHSHNLLEAYYADGNNTFHYNSLKSGNNFFKVEFTRTVTAVGVNLNLTSVTSTNGAQPSQQDLDFLLKEVTEFQGRPLDGNECVTLGWTYLGNMKDNAANIQAAITDCESHGHLFIPLFYQSGYFVFGCVEDKLFYDKNT